MKIGEMVKDMILIDRMMGKFRPRRWYYQYLIGDEFEKNLKVMVAQGGSPDTLMDMYDSVIKEG